MQGLPQFVSPKLLVGTENYDDAGVYLLDENTALIQTLDFFTPITDDPYLFGQIAAANALSDIYAMGGLPLLAMNIAAFPLCSDTDRFRRILLGGADKIKEAGAILLGGHTVDDQEPKYGLSVTGIAHPRDIKTNGGAKEGDLLFLTKRLGNGIVSTGFKVGAGDPVVWQSMWEEMASLNKDAALAMNKAKAHAATDITGFGLLGHLHEMTAASGLGAEIWAANIPYWPLAAQLAAEGIVPGGAYRNREYLKNDVVFASGVRLELQDILCDPQTSGGLLMAIPKCRGTELEVYLEQAGLPYAIVGQMTAGHKIRVLKG